MKKGDICAGTVETVLFPNRGQVTVDDQTVTVKNTIPGQQIRFQINKKRNGRCEGRLLEVTAPSPLETEDPGCSLFPACGGCLYRTMSYKSQLQMKEEQIRRLFLDSSEGDPDACFEGVKASPASLAYRNKMEYSFGDCEKGGTLTLGLHRRGSMYDVLTAADCRIVHEDFNRITAAALAFCREQGWTYCSKKTHEGYLRHLLVRRASMTGE